MMKIVIKKILTLIIKIKKYIKNSTKDTVIDLLYSESISESAEYINKNISEAVIFENHHMLWDYALTKINKNGLFLEFGVFEGYSINYFSKKIPDQNFYGFDSFNGLKEDWYGTQHTIGMFNRNGKLPKVHNNVILIKGWFNETLPIFLKMNKEKISFLHIDIDTYPSTKYVLDELVERITSGTIIIFDEYHGFPGWKQGEFKAWKQLCSQYNFQYKYIAFSNQQAAIIII